MTKQTKLFLVVVSLLLLEVGAAQEVRTLGDMAKAFMSSHMDFGKLIVGISYISGIGFGIAAVYKFKQYKDNPTQIPIGTPFALLMVSILMVSMPGLINVVTMTLFGSDNKSSSICTKGLPGGERCP